jgi:hypothetical protein
MLPWLVFRQKHMISFTNKNRSNHGLLTGIWMWSYSLPFLASCAFMSTALCYTNQRMKLIHVHKLFGKWPKQHALGVFNNYKICMINTYAHYHAALHTMPLHSRKKQALDHLVCLISRRNRSTHTIDHWERWHWGGVTPTSLVVFIVVQLGIWWLHLMEKHGDHASRLSLLPQ